MSELLSPRCIERPGFLFLKQRHHEPDDSAYLGLASYRPTHPAHIRLGRTPRDAGSVEHFVPTVCRHCHQAYWARFDWRANGTIAWRPSDEIEPKEANTLIHQAWLWWRSGGTLIRLGDGFMVSRRWADSFDEQREAAIEYLRGARIDYVPCLACLAPVIGRKPTCDVCEWPVGVVPERAEAKP